MNSKITLTDNSYPLLYSYIQTKNIHSSNHTTQECSQKRMNPAEFTQKSQAKLNTMEKCNADDTESCGGDEQRSN